MSVEILMRLLIGHLLNKEWESIFGNKDPIEIENPISSEQSVLKVNFSWRFVICSKKIIIKVSKLFLFLSLDLFSGKIKKFYKEIIL